MKVNGENNGWSIQFNYSDFTSSGGNLHEVKWMAYSPFQQEPPIPFIPSREGGSDPLYWRKTVFGLRIGRVCKHYRVD